MIEYGFVESVAMELPDAVFYRKRVQFQMNFCDRYIRIGCRIDKIQCSWYLIFFDEVNHSFLL